MRRGEKYRRLKPVICLAPLRDWEVGVGGPCGGRRCALMSEWSGWPTFPLLLWRQERLSRSKLLARLLAHSWCSVTGRMALSVASQRLFSVSRSLMSSKVWQESGVCVCVCVWFKRRASLFQSNAKLYHQLYPHPPMGVVHIQQISSYHFIISEEMMVCCISFHPMTALPCPATQLSQHPHQPWWGLFWLPTLWVSVPFMCSHL